MSRYEYGSQSTGQAQRDLVEAVRRIAEYAQAHPGRPITCEIVLDLPEPPSDYDQPTPA